MAHRKQPGPKTPWEKRVRYNRAKCETRLKPCQIQNLAAADAFASRIGKTLNGYLTIKFSESGHPLNEFRAGVKRLSQWHRRWGGELRWIYVWEASGGFHVHALVHVPRGAWKDFDKGTARAFAGHDVMLKRRTDGPSAMAYLCKGTDLRTHWKLRGHSRIYAKAQGRIAWKRCGCSENIGRKARELAGFPSTICAKTCTRQSNTKERTRSVANAGNCRDGNIPSLGVSKGPHSPLEVSGGAAHTTQAPYDTGARFLGNKFNLLMVENNAISTRTIRQSQRASEIGKKVSRRN
jgi:hypothetical protein